MAHNLPVQLTRFVGRQREMADIGHLMKDTRLLSIVGPPGCGKSRLALQFANTVIGSFQDGVWLAELSPLRDPTFLPQLIGKTLDIRRRPEESALESLLHYLKSKEILLVLDNCEHLIADCARLVQQILSQTGAFHILVTSREPLAIAGELTYPVAGLACPPAGAGDAQDVMQYDAVSLFVDRARALLPEFEITAANAPSIVRICQQLDGLPLALELASAHTNVLSPQELLARLDDRFRLLASKQRHEPDARHRTLRTAINWSYDLLPPPEQVMLNRLSAFAGGWSLASAEAICAGDGIEHEQILALLSSLVGKSLVVSQPFLPAGARYSLLETIWQYGREKLIASGEWPAMRGRHLQYFLEVCEDTAPKLRGAYQQLWLAFLDNEHDNIRAALDTALEDGRVSDGLRITASLYQFWRIRNYLDEGLDWCRRLFAEASQDISPLVRANALVYASLMAGLKGQLQDQLRYSAEAVVLAEAAGESGKPVLADVLGAMGYATRKAGDPQTAFKCIVRQTELLRELGDDYRLGVALTLGSFFAMSAGKLEGARAMLDEGLPLLRQIGDPYRIAMALNYVGDLARCERNYQEAHTAYEESISILRKINATGDFAAALHNLGHVCLHLGDVERAMELFGESMASHQDQGNRSGMAEGLLGFAALAIVADFPGAGARLLSAGAKLGGRQFTAEWAATRMDYEHYLDRARASLTERAFQTEQAAGQRLSLEQAVTYAQDVAQKTAGGRRARHQLDRLSPREREVAGLIAQARSNDEIAAELVVSKRTVESHIASILSKLTFRNRAQIVRWAIEAGLAPTGEHDPS